MGHPTPAPEPRPRLGSKTERQHAARVAKRREAQADQVNGAPVPVGFWRKLGRGIGRLFGRSYYEADKSTSRFREFSTRAAGPNAITFASAMRLRDRSRDMVRNDPHCARAVQILLNNIIGSGITPTASTGASLGTDPSPEAEALALEADRVWREWSAPGVADAEGQFSLDALTGIAVRAWVESGEVLFRRRFDKALYPVPWRLEVLEADMLDAELNITRTDGKNGTTEGGRITQGVELDARGRRVAYWILTQHPGEAGVLYQGASRESERVPATEIIHLFMPTRPRQVRGIPFLSTILAAKKDLGDYEAYHLLSKKSESAVVAFVIPSDEQLETEVDDEGVVASALDSDGNAVETLEPGLIVRLNGGKDVRFNQPSLTGGYAEYKRAMLQSIAVGMQVSYEQLTGDLSQANYSSLRAGLLEFWRHIEQLQWLFLIPLLHQHLWSWAMQGAWLQGELPVPSVPVDWSTPRRQSVDPSKDVLADIMQIRAGLAPWDEKIGESGYQATEVFRRAAAVNAKLDEMGLIFDADPRKMAFRGAFPPATRGTAADGVTPLGDVSGNGDTGGDGSAVEE